MLISCMTFLFVFVKKGFGTTQIIQTNSKDDQGSD